jgi:hypothetical protein
VLDYKYSPFFFEKIFFKNFCIILTTYLS